MGSRALPHLLQPSGPLGFAGLKDGAVLLLSWARSTALGGDGPTGERSLPRATGHSTSLLWAN